MTELFSGVYDYDGGPRVHHDGHLYYNPDILREEYVIQSLPESRQLDVTISGGSMAGLFTAHALQQSGHNVDIYERTEYGKMQGRGGGIVPDPELFVYMEKHGLASRDEVSVVTDGIDYLDQDGSVRAHESGEIYSAGWDTFYVALRDAVGMDHYHMDRQVSSFEQANGGVTTTFQTGETVESDLAISAEGYKSPTRQRLLPDVEMEYAGYLAWRGLLPQSDLPDDLAEYLGTTYVIYHGDDFQILTYPVPGADGSTEPGERRVNLVWYQNVPEGEELDDLLLDKHGRQHEGSLPPGLLREEARRRQERLARERCPEPFVRYVESLPELYIQCIYDVKVPQMVFDRTLILGDGAFFVRPHMAAGTSKAAADGFRLAEAISTHEDLDAGLADWEETQLELGHRLVDMARERGDRYMHRQSRPTQNP